MVGRGAQGQPWIVGQIGAQLAGTAPVPAPWGTALAELVVEHYEAMLAEYGTAVGLRAARKHLGWYLGRRVSAGTGSCGARCSPPTTG